MDLARADGILARARQPQMCRMALLVVDVWNVELEEESTLANDYIPAMVKQRALPILRDAAFGGFSG